LKLTRPITKEDIPFRLISFILLHTAFVLSHSYLHQKGVNKKWHSRNK